MMALAAVNRRLNSPCCRFLFRSVSTSGRNNKPKVVVVGSGWGGYALAKQLDSSFYDVHVVSPRNFMLFTPLLASTAVGTLEFRSISQPVPSGVPHARYHMANLAGVDFFTRTLNVTTVSTPGQEPLGDRTATLPYDLLVLAPGARNNTFGIPGVEQHAMYLKELWHARAIRSRTIANVQAASFPGVSAEERRRLLSFVIVGGGPTGVEYAAELHDFIAQDLNRLYPHAAADLSITLIEGKSILGSFDASLRAYAEKKFARDKIAIRTGANVTRVEEGSISLSGGGKVPYGVLVWNTGLAPQPVVQSLSHICRDRWGHILVNECLQVMAEPTSALADTAAPPQREQVEEGKPNTDVPLAGNETSSVPSATGPSKRLVLPGVYALGDAASVIDRNYAATAQVAEQQGTYLAQELNAAARAVQQGKTIFPATIPGPSPTPIPGLDPSISALIRQPPTRPFGYLHRGSLAMLGGFLAVTDWTQGGPLAILTGTRVKGFASWVLWRSVYLTKLGSWRNRLQVPADWLRTLVFGRDVTAF